MSLFKKFQVPRTQKTSWNIFQSQKLFILSNLFFQFQDSKKSL